MNIETFMVVGLCADDACVSNMRCLMARNVLKTRSLRVAAQHLAQQTGTFSNASPLGLLNRLSDHCRALSYSRFPFVFWFWKTYVFISAGLCIYISLTTVEMLSFRNNTCRLIIDTSISLFRSCVWAFGACQHSFSAPDSQSKHLSLRFLFQSLVNSIFALPYFAGDFRVNSRMSLPHAVNAG